MARRLKKLTAQACLDAVAEWIKSDVDLVAGQTRLITADGALWIELLDFKPFKFPDLGNDDMPPVRAVLQPRAPSDLHEPFSDTVLVIDLLDKDATPRRSASGSSVTVDRPLPWRTIAIVATPDGAEARDVRIVPHGLGERRSWPLPD